RSEPVITSYNRYIPDGNCSVLVAIDSNLLGENNYYSSELLVQQIIKRWLKPFEDRFDLNFNVKNVTTFTPGENDNLDVSMEKIPEEISWRLAVGVDAENVEGNNYDWLFIYQENYLGGRNRANAINGNALIIAHNQPVFDRQLIFLHEVGHIYGGAHNDKGEVNPDWYQGENYSIMDYEDLIALEDVWDGKSLPLDKHNYQTINSTKFRFDQKDPELDGLPNYFEYRYGFDPTINDSHTDYDNDGLSNLEEYEYGTNPVNKDSDQDGFSDWAEKYLNTSPLNPEEVPEVNVPIIIPWTKQRIITENEVVNLTWRGISSNPNYYEIFQNDSLLIHQSWESELIQYQLEESTPGFWNYTCQVVDIDGDTVYSEIILQIRSVNKTTLALLGPLFCIFGLIIRKKYTAHRGER
ncbi:MAG: hypothetical protein ACFFFH_12045, partial [Candidatus Thorarchaeota archaeon]